MKLTKELFEDVIVYRMSEPGAMGYGGVIEFLKKSGESFELNYLSEATPWEEIKKFFPAIKGCRFNGRPMGEENSSGEIVIGADGALTKVNFGWKLMYLDFGHHMVCKEQYFSTLKEVFKDMDNCEIAFNGIEKLKEVNFVGRSDEIEKTI